MCCAMLQISRDTKYESKNWVNVEKKRHGFSERNHVKTAASTAEILDERQTKQFADEHIVIVV